MIHIKDIISSYETRLPKKDNIWAQYTGTIQYDNHYAETFDHSNTSQVAPRMEVSLLLPLFSYIHLLKHEWTDEDPEKPEKYMRFHFAHFTRCFLHSFLLSLDRRNYHYKENNKNRRNSEIKSRSVGNWHTGGVIIELYLRLHSFINQLTHSENNYWMPTVCQEMCQIPGWGKKTIILTIREFISWG